MLKNQWTVSQAKARFSEVLHRASSRGPQTITRNGKLAAVIISSEKRRRKTRRTGTLADFLATSPLQGAKLQLERVHDSPRSAF
jgi:prevent-host-death family protein